MVYSITFLTGLSLLLIHEMDAIRCKEWRMFPGFSDFNDKSGYVIFVFAHVPILCWLFWQLFIGTKSWGFRCGVDIFLIVHVMLHLLVLKNKRNEFKDWISWILIIGAGGCGLADLVLIWNV